MTAPITSNRPTTTRLHHYAGRQSHGSGIPVETFFTPAWGASTPVEIFFAHAHPKWLIFDHFHLAGAIFLSQRHPKLSPGATQGRSFFHTAPRDDTESPPVWRAPRGMEPGRGAHGRRQGQGGPRDDAPRLSAHQAPLVWRAPEGPEGTGGLRDRPLRAFRLACGDLAGGRARRRPEHQRRHTATTCSANGERAGRRPPAHTAARPSRHPAMPKGRVPKYPPLVGSLSHCLVEAQAE